jgi:hypothetical protein
LGAVNTVALGINAAGRVVGSYQKDGNVNGFFYSSGTYTTLSIPGMLEVEAGAINASGDIVGKCLEQTAHGFRTNGFFSTNGVYAVFTHPSGTSTTAPHGINSAGNIVGDYQYPKGNQRGFLYINGLYASGHHRIGDQR